MIRLMDFLILIIFCVVPGTSLASAPPKDVENLAQDFKMTKKQLEEAELKQRKVLSALYQINKKIKNTVTEKSELTRDKASLGVQVRSLSQKVADLEARAKSQRALLAERLRAIYKLGGPSLARYLFSSSSSADLERNLKILGKVAARDVDLIKDYSHDLQELESKRRALANRLEGLKTVEQKVANQEARYRKELTLKNKLLDGIRKSRLFALNRIQGLREKSLNFNFEDAGVLDLLFKASFADQQGFLPSPLEEGVVTQKFGLMKGQDQPYTVNHKGVYFTAPAGKPVRSVFSGKVSYVGQIPGYGSTLIVDHGDHYYSVYAHTEAVKVKEGDEVSQKQVLAQVGSGLYFEIRHFSEPYDPQLWMKGL